MKNENQPNKETHLKKLQMSEMGLFHTPETVDEIAEYIDSLPGNVAAQCWVVYGLLNNLIVDRMREKRIVLNDRELARAGRYSEIVNTFDDLSHS